jgi:hypothetical protein
MRMSKVIVVSCLLVSSAAVAQPGAEPPSPDSEPAVPPPAPAPPAAMVPPPGAPQPLPPGAAQAPSEVDRGVVEDANSGRSWLMPTALMEPAGTWSFTDFELFMVGLGYSVTDRMSISVTTLLPIVSDMPVFLLGNAKLQVIRSGNLRVAVQGAMTYVQERNTGNNYGASAGELGAAATLCIDTDCRSHVSGFIGAGFAHDTQSSVPFLVAGSLAMSMNKHVKAIVEADSAFIAGDINEQANGFLAWYGLRFTSETIGVDLGFAKPVCDGCSNGDLPMGAPFVSFTYRSFKE